MCQRTPPAGFQKDMPYQSTHLFLVRVWLEKHAKGTDEAKLCGRVQDVSTAHAYDFRGGSELEELLLSMIPQGEMDRSSETKYVEHEGKT